MDSGTLKLFGILVFMGILFAGITKYGTQRGMDGLNAYAEKAMNGEIDPEEQMKRIEEVWVPEPEPEPTNAPLYGLILMGGLIVVAAPLAMKKIWDAERAELEASRAAAVDAVRRQQAQKAQEQPQGDGTEGNYTSAPITRVNPNAD